MEELTWTTKEGVRLSIPNMETSHIKNCINMMEVNGKTTVIRGGSDMWGVYADEVIHPVYEALCNERTKRAKGVIWINRN